MGLGGLHHAGPGALQPLGTGGGAEFWQMRLSCPKRTAGVPLCVTSLTKSSRPAGKPDSFRLDSPSAGFRVGLTEKFRVKGERERGARDE